MSIGTLGIISMQRSTDVAAMSPSDSTRAMQQQSVAQTAVEKNSLVKSENVIKKDNADMTDSKFDAKEKGQNEYVMLLDKKKKKEKEDGKVTVKSKGHSSFDVSV